MHTADSVRARLTDRQAAIYRFICDHVKENGFPPTVREIGAAFGIVSPNGVMCHIKALESKGWVRRRPGKRTLSTGNDTRPRCIEILGRISAGGLLEAVEHADAWNLADLFADVDAAAVVEGPILERLHVKDGDALLFAHGKCVGMIRTLGKHSPKSRSVESTSSPPPLLPARLHAHAPARTGARVRRQKVPPAASRLLAVASP